jgi:hypothetical protein
MLRREDPRPDSHWKMQFDPAKDIIYFPGFFLLSRVWDHSYYRQLQAAPTNIKKLIILVYSLRNFKEEHYHGSGPAPGLGKLKAIIAVTVHVKGKTSYELVGLT